MIPDSEIPKCPEFEVKSKIAKIFKNHNFLEGFIKLILVFMNTMKKIQVDNNGCKYILFRTDIYFSEYSLEVETDEKGHTDRDFIFEEKRQKALEKKLGCKFIRINTSNTKNGYDLDYEVNGIEAFIDEFQNKKIKEVKDENKELKDKNKELEEKLEKLVKKLKEKEKEKEAEIKKTKRRKYKAKKENKKFNNQPY